MRSSKTKQMVFLSSTFFLFSIVSNEFDWTTQHLTRSIKIETTPQFLPLSQFRLNSSSISKNQPIQVNPPALIISQKRSSSKTCLWRLKPESSGVLRHRVFPVLVFYSGEKERPRQPLFVSLAAFIKKLSSKVSLKATSESNKNNSSNNNNNWWRHRHTWIQIIVTSWHHRVALGERWTLFIVWWKNQEKEKSRFCVKIDN